MESPHTRAAGRNDSIYSEDGIEPLGLHSEQAHGRRTQEIRFSETVGDKERVNIHSKKYATRWDPEISPGVRHRHHRVSRPAPYSYYEPGQRSDPRVKILPRLSPPRGRRSERHFVRDGDHEYNYSDEDLNQWQPQARGKSRAHARVHARAHGSPPDHSDDPFKIIRESGHIFNFRLKKPQSTEQAPTQTGLEVPSSTSGVRKWAALRLKKDELFQENECKVQRSRYKSSLSGLQDSVADLEREEPHIPSSDSRPLLLQWK